jgi:hypothetical protein
VENLNISGMARNRHLAGKILDASWGRFLHMLSYKAARAGRGVVGVDPRGTSQNLPEGFDRDHVAACRILSLGLERPEGTPAERGPLLGVPASALVAGQAPSLRNPPAEAGDSSQRMRQVLPRPPTLSPLPSTSLQALLATLTPTAIRAMPLRVTPTA